MGPLDQFNHLLNFLAPAAFLALGLPLAARVLMGKKAPVGVYWASAAIVFVAGAAVLGAGLWWFGRDGKMASYATLAVVTASLQWLLARGWRR